MTSMPRRLGAARTPLAALLALTLFGSLTVGQLSPPAAAATAEAVSLSALQIEKKSEPDGIDVDKPRFSWLISSTERDVMQESYRLRINSTTGDDWSYDSGVVDSIESANVEYVGEALPPATQFEWTVDVTTNAGSATAHSTFSTGLYAAADWAGSQWIGNERGQESPGGQLNFDGVPWIWSQEDSTGSAPGEPRAFRYTHESPDGKTASKADILITADDSFRLWAGGSLLGATEGAVNEWQQSHQFTADLAGDENVFAVRTTNGANSPAGLIVSMVISYDDGSTEKITTGTDWKVSKSVPEGFQEPDFDDSGWDAAVVQATYGSGPWGSGVRDPQQKPAAAPLLRKEFTVDGDIAKATIHYAAGGYANVSLNGEPISDEMLAPGFTDYDDTVQYVSTDLTAQLAAGDNALGMELGRGFYGMTGSNVWNWESPPWHDEPVVRALLRIEYSDGRVQNVITDDSWTIHDGPTVFDDLYAGETYDASREIPGYDTAGFDDANWGDAAEVGGPQGELVNQRQQPIRVRESLPASSITAVDDDIYVVKFPRILAGNVRITAEGAAGSTIRFQYGEKLRDNGRPNFDNNGGFGSGFQTDRFILAGTGAPESWEARFSYKGFQYIEVTGWPEGSEPTVDNFTAQAVHTDAAETGTFDSASDIMNRVHRATVDTLLNNLHGIPTDTPMFEKNGWTGDAAVGAEMFMMNLDTHELFAKWMRDIDETRDAAGAPLVIAPSSGQWGQWGVAPTWHSAYVNIPRWLHQYGGDDRVMTELYDNLKQYVDLEFSRSPGGIANTRLADWVAPEASPAGGNAPEDSRVSATAYLYNMLQSMEKTATYLGHDADAAQFAENAVVVKDAFNATFLDADAGYYRGNGDRGYRQTHNALALAFGLTPDTEMKQRVADSIAANVIERGNTLNTGVLGTKYLLPVLTENGYSDLAYTLAVQTAYPSWGYIVENGGTSMWEHWSLEARSLGHYFLGTVEDWYFHDVGGIEASEITGYRDIEIKPAVTAEMDWANTSLATPFGTVSNDWKSSKDGALTMDVTVPVGTEATVHLPAENGWAVSESGSPLEDVKGVRDIAVADGSVVVTVGSGEYSFVVDPDLSAVGTVIDQFDATLQTVAALTEAGDINSSQAQRLRAPLEEGRSEAVSALEALREGERVDAAESLASAIGEVDSFDELVAALDADAATVEKLQGAATTLRSVVEDAINALLELSATVTFAEAGYRPGESADAVLAFSNGGSAEVQNVNAALALQDADWEIEPAGAVLIADSLAGGATAEGAVTVAVPQDALPATPAATATFDYEFGGATISLRAKTSLVVDSPLIMESVTVTPSEAESGSVVEIEAEIRNDGTTPVSGRLEVVLPEGWQPSLPSEQLVIPAGESVAVTAAVYVPRDAEAASRSITLGANFTRGEVTLASGEVKLDVVLGELPTVGDARHADLGDAADEAEHELTASESSGTSSEAGLTRRYAGHLTPFSYFEFDMEVDEGEPFVVRAIETYDKPQEKRYKIYVDDEEVFLRSSSHTDGAGTETFEFVVDEKYATSDIVRIRFENQDNAAYYDPSIADVWTLPVPADVNAPQLRASFDPATPNLATGWYQEVPVGIDLEASDDRGDATIEYRFGDDEFAAFTEALSVEEEGEHALDYRARDAVGNEVMKSATVRIDATAPVTEAEAGETTARATATGPVTVTLTATDAGSGVAGTQLRIDGEDWTDASEIVLDRAGDYLVEFFSTDVAGNAEAVQSLEVTVTGAPGGGGDDGDNGGGDGSGDEDGADTGGDNDSGAPGQDDGGLPTTGGGDLSGLLAGAAILIIAGALLWVVRSRKVRQ
ncbi:MAG: family 78 glycoside hydrolase catalytic domain [Microbacterium sp.]|uniref:family 78 glycoside hydrolase catalytic domain n=1 Tax=Microbacterium sp. TaxID=51671 RepID=UPI003F9BDBAB